MKSEFVNSVATSIKPISFVLPPDVKGTISFEIHIETPPTTAVRIIEISIDTTAGNPNPIRYGQASQGDVQIIHK